MASHDPQIRPPPPPHHHHLQPSPGDGGVSLVEARWDACYDIALRRFFYSTLAGAASGLLFFRSPVTRWAAVAFGAGVGLGSAYTDCSHIMVGALPKWPLPSNIPPNSHVGPEDS